MRKQNYSSTSSTLLTSQAARELNVAAKTVRQWADAGKLPCTKTPNGIRIFSTHEVQKFARSRDE